MCAPCNASVLEEVRDTYHDVRRLEASIIELHKMFMDLALLVDRQGEMLDQIEYQVQRVVSFARPRYDSAHVEHRDASLSFFICLCLLLMKVVLTANHV